MIVFDLTCEQAGHIFEAWFGSTDDYQSQKARGLVSCPVCGDMKVDKAMMAPRVSAKSNTRATPAKSYAKGDTAPPTPAEVKAMLTKLADAQKRALDGSDYVGGRFADEARAIHLGETEQRSIHGEATPVEAKSLIEDGISVAPLPFPIRPPNTDN